MLIIGLFMPWYYQSTTADGKYYEMNAFGGSLVGFKEGRWILTPYPLLFDLTIAYLSVIFGLFSIFLPLTYMRLVEKSQRKWIAIMSLLGGVAALANIFYIHFWLGWYYSDGLLFSSDANGSRGPSLGYFLTWAAVVTLFASTYVSQGLVQVLPAKTKTTEKAETKQM